MAVGKPWRVKCSKSCVGASSGETKALGSLKKELVSHTCAKAFSGEEFCAMAESLTVSSKGKKLYLPHL